MDTKLSVEQLQRKAVVYVRQSSMVQVIHNLESQRRQYGLTERAEELGFRDIEVIDEDLGRSGGGCEERPGFERLVAKVCSGEVGGVICVEASRLARNGRDWHRLIELCALVGTVIIDPEGIYDPSITNDRLLLGLKGTMSEFELNLIRQRSREAIQQKAKRGELQFRLPVGLCWNGDHIELEPDQHCQQVVRLVFQKMQELGSVRQVFRWFLQERLQVPAHAADGKSIFWKRPRYNTIMSILANPFYAGAYAFGRTKIRTRMVDGHVRKFKEDHRRDRGQWLVLIRDHHPGYISWEQFEIHRQLIDANAHMKPRTPAKAGRGGRALLAGLLRCRRCGRMLEVNYAGAQGKVLRYRCRSCPPENPDCPSVTFGGVKADELVVQQVLRAVSGNAIAAALRAAQRERQRQGDQRRSLEMGLAQARYQAQLAERRYEAVDPDQRLVAGELEARWNLALEKVRAAEAQCAEFEQRLAAVAIPSRASLLSLAQDLPAVWQASSDMRLKQRIVRLVLREIVADVDPASRAVTLVLHWAGDRHSQVRWTKNSAGWQGRSTLTVQAIIRKMALAFPDPEIALTLNRQQRRTAAGTGWTAKSVAGVRQQHQIPEFQHDASRPATLSLLQAAGRLQVGSFVVLRLIREGILPARQVVACAPWEIADDAINSEAVKAALARRRRRKLPRVFRDDRQQHMFSDT